LRADFCPSAHPVKKIRDDKGYWNQLEQYISQRSDATFTHSICPECTKKLYAELLSEHIEPPPE
jgi:hypothetical protein